MSRFPSVTGKQLLKLLSTHGFKPVRRKGSHCFIRHNDGRGTVIPLHGNESIGTGLLAKILRDLELSKTDLFEN